MTPAARVAAAIEVLDRIGEGTAAEKALTNWARTSRYAGSKDRAAVRDHVFEVLRNRRSFARLGGGETGRALLLGALRASGTDPATLFSGQGYGPSAVTQTEASFVPGRAERAVELDCPAWLEAPLQKALGEDFAPVMQLQKTRAPVFVRANLLKTTPEAAAMALRAEDIETRPHPLAQTALELMTNPRRLRGSAAFRDGLVELQDVASQAVCDMLPVLQNARYLDYCAGGGGKTLALAARGVANIFAHDADEKRMTDLPARAKRAGAKVALINAKEIAQAPAFDVIIADVPCSGSGAWRRSPDGKWRLTVDKLDELLAIQRGILREISDLSGPRAQIAYITCSLLHEENEAQIAGFLSENPQWHLTKERRFSPLEGGDGFYLALLKRE